MSDTTARDALARTICARAALCTHDELRELDQALLAIERRRVLRGLAELRDADVEELRTAAALEFDYGALEDG